MPLPHPTDRRPTLAEAAIAPWHGATLLALLVMLLPLDHSSALSAPALTGLTELLSGGPHRLYEFIKSAMLWVPLGAVAIHVGNPRRLSLLAMSALLCLALIGMAVLPQPRVSDVLELLYAFPGLSLGAWLGYRTRAFQTQTRAASAHLAAEKMSANHAPARRPPSEVAVEVAEEVRNESGHAAPRKRSRRGKRRHAPERVVGWLIASRLLALALLLPIILMLSSFSRWPTEAALLCVIYAGLLWWKPDTWLLLVPAALPLLDLAPWTGRILFDEFDLLMLVTLMLGLLRPPVEADSSRRDKAFLLAIGLFGLSYLSSGLIGLLPLPALDANALNGYWSGYNSVRVAKGLAWALVIIFLLRRGVEDPRSALLQRFVPGMWLGLLGVCLVAFWERWQFAGLLDFDHVYRIVATFSSMHTGGGHIEAYLVAAIPFLWLTIGRWRLALTLGMPLFVLTVYVMLSTVSRGGVLALAIVLAILALGSWRQARAEKIGHSTWIFPGLLLLASAGMLAAGVSGGYLQQRLAQVEKDWDIRMTHWRNAVSIMDPGAPLFGMGLGRFPATYLYSNPEGKALATYTFVDQGGETFLRLGQGETLYMAQKIDLQPGTRYRLSLDLRGHGGRLDAPVCEKQLLDSKQCRWLSFTYPVDPGWRRVEQAFNSGAMGTGNWLTKPPLELFLYNPSKGLVDVDNVRLLDERGMNLLRNGDFSQGGDAWFFKTHSHLPWHIKNLWVETYFSQGLLGLIALLSLLALFLNRAVAGLWRGDPLATALTASVTGMLVVGVFDSLLDTPRIALLFLGLILIGSMRSTLSSDGKHRQRSASSSRDHHRTEVLTQGMPADGS